MNEPPARQNPVRTLASLRDFEPGTHLSGVTSMLIANETEQAVPEDEGRPAVRPRDSDSGSSGAAVTRRLLGSRCGRGGRVGGDLDLPPRRCQVGGKCSAGFGEAAG